MILRPIESFLSKLVDQQRMEKSFFDEWNKTENNMGVFLCYWKCTEEVHWCGNERRGNNPYVNVCSIECGWIMVWICTTVCGRMIQKKSRVKCESELWFESHLCVCMFLWISTPFSFLQQTHRMITTTTAIKNSSKTESKTATHPHRFPNSHSSKTPSTGSPLGPWAQKHS